MTENAKAPAFPLPADFEGENVNGLTKREYFAAMAMQGLAHNASVYDVGYLVKKSVEVADALLSALAKDVGHG